MKRLLLAVVVALALGAGVVVGQFYQVGQDPMPPGQTWQGATYAISPGWTSVALTTYPVMQADGVAVAHYQITALYYRSDTGEQTTLSWIVPKLDKLGAERCRSFCTHNPSDPKCIACLIEQ
jgi:hypothetical protein